MQITKKELYEETDGVPLIDCMDESEEAVLMTGNGMRLMFNAEFITTSGDSFPDEPTKLDAGEALLRVKLLQEELRELEEALAAGDLVETLDALIDIQYVLDGTVLKTGLQREFIKGFLLVHENNMQKFPGGVCTRNEFGKIVKPEGFKNIDLGEHYPYLRG